MQIEEIIPYPVKVGDVEISTDLEDTTREFVHILPLKNYWDPKVFQPIHFQELC